MRTVLRSTLEAAVRDETEVQDHVSQAEMWRRIDSSYRKVFDLLVESFGQSYFRADPARITALAGVSEYDLPADFYNAVAVRATVAGFTVPVKRLDPQNAHALENLPAASSSLSFFYEILGRQRTSALTTFKDAIALRPTPAAPFALVVEYVPIAANFETGGDVTYLDVNGWASDYVVADVSAYCLRKRQQDPSAHLMERDETAARIMRHRDARDAQPGKVRDVRSYRGRDADDRGGR